MDGIADYRFVRHLGEGNHGDYWLAATPDRLLESVASRTLPPSVATDHVAVKTLSQQASDTDFKRMANELRIYAQVSSPHLVPVLDAGHQDGRLFYTIPWFQEGSLAAPTRPRSWVEVCHSVADAARGAHALHEAGVAHRDIKPANVLVAEGRGYLTDLGLAQIINPGQTVTGLGPVGTVEYLAPEVVRGAPASRASDVWSLGVTLHRVLTGLGVFSELDAKPLLEALRTVLDDRPVLSPGLREPERSIVARALSADPTDRFATALALATDLDAAVAGVDA